MLVAISSCPCRWSGFELTLPGSHTPKTLSNEHWTSVGKEPDYRFTLANERTFLAWIRTALAILASGVLLDQFAADLRHPRLVLWLALALVAVASVLSIAAFVRWRRNQIAMRLEASLDHGHLIPVAATCLAAVSAAMLLLLVT